MSKKEKLIKELIDLIGEDRFTEEEKEDLKNLSEEDLEFIKKMFQARNLMVYNSCIIALAIIL